MTEITDIDIARAERREVIAKTICKSGRFETGEGTCAVACMDHLGVSRRSCGHAARVHGALAQQIDEALAAYKAGRKAEREAGQ
jgi:hypothetical protein